MIFDDAFFLIKDDCMSSLTMKKINVRTKIEIDCTNNQHFELLFSDKQNVEDYAHNFVLVMLLCFELIITNLSYNSFKVFRHPNSRVSIRYYSGPNFEFPCWVVGSYNFVKITEFAQVILKIHMFLK
jgi:hypothetical protein